MRFIATFVASLLVLTVAVTSVSAQAPDSLSFQGYVTDPGGVPINTPGVSMTFKLYEGSSEIWSETQPSVKVDGGVFNVLLGSVTALDTVAFNRPLLLGIKVGADPEISPRTPLAAAAYAKALPGMYTFYRENGSKKSYNVIGGAANNFVGVGVVGATIPGGGGMEGGTIDAVPNTVLDDWGTVGGGRGNTASGSVATVGGGRRNEASGTGGTVPGGILNTANGFYTTVGGGFNNTASGSQATVPGGVDNSARGSASFAVGHAAKAIHKGTFVWNDKSVDGGNDSLLSTGENQFLIRAAGGVGIGTNNPNSGSQLDVAGPIHISGAQSETLLFKGTNAAGTPNGTGIRLRYDFTFGGGGKDYLVIEKTDLSNADPAGGIAFVNTGSDGIGRTALIIKGDGEVGIGTSFPDATVHVKSSSAVPQLQLENTSTNNYARIRMSNGAANYWDVAAGAALNDELNLYSSLRGNILSLRATGTDAIVAYGGATLTTSGVWANASTFEKKTDFSEIDAHGILETLARLPVRQWRYKVEPSTTKHVGPTAEDFHEAFNLGESSTTIGTVDADGVALAAIQGLYELVQELQSEVKALKADRR
jgi:hypothetical protein